MASESVPAEGQKKKNSNLLYVNETVHGVAQVWLSHLIRTIASVTIRGTPPPSYRRGQA